MSGWVKQKSYNDDLVWIIQYKYMKLWNKLVKDYISQYCLKMYLSRLSMLQTSHVHIVYKII